MTEMCLNGICQAIVFVNVFQPYLRQHHVEGKDLFMVLPLPFVN